MTEIKDSGSRRTFNTGSVRDAAKGKGRYDLISTIATDRLAKHCEAGAEKYEERNWEMGQPLHVYLDSALRHIRKIQEGHTDEDHEAAAYWNLMAFIHTREMVKRGCLPRELDDIPAKIESPNQEIKVGDRVRVGDYFETHKGKIGTIVRMPDYTTFYYHVRFDNGVVKWLYNFGEFVKL